MTQAVTVLPPETTTNGNCEDLQVDGSDGRIDISGLTAPIEIVQVFDENYQIIFRCEGTECGAAQTLDNLEEGVYRVNALAATVAVTIAMKEIVIMEVVVITVTMVAVVEK